MCPTRAPGRVFRRVNAGHHRPCRAEPVPVCVNQAVRQRCSPACRCSPRTDGLPRGRAIRLRTRKRRADTHQCCQRGAYRAQWGRSAPGVQTQIALYFQLVGQKGTATLVADVRQLHHNHHKQVQKLRDLFDTQQKQVRNAGSCRGTHAPGVASSSPVLCVSQAGPSTCVCGCCRRCGPGTFGTRSSP